MNRLLFPLVLAVSTPALAQSTPASANAGVIAIREMWEAQSGYLLRAAEQMPDSDYAFKPVATVRTFGQLIGHVAGSQNAFCAAAVGDPERAEDAVEKSMTTKAQLVGALRASSEYCRRAYAQTDAAAAQAITLFGEKHTRMWALALNATHDGEHYGNVVTYFRIRGMVPPSSQPRP
ncbi:MAG: DinB family protein [Gemmatimonadetes bacterium]|nr:MAG: DinB family protein [Gemmatimonadota bacterium]